MTNKLTSLTGFGEGDPKPEKSDLGTRIMPGHKRRKTSVTHERDSGGVTVFFKRANYNRGASAKAKALSAKMGKGMSHHQKMEARGMRYQAAKMPENYTSMSQADRIAYYKKNKGSYVSNEVDSKTGKYKNTY